MEKPISSFLRSTFLIHLIIGGLLGIFIFLIPGRTLTWFGWVGVNVTFANTDLVVPGTLFVDGTITRLLGAAMLALAFSSFLGWRASTWNQVSLIVQAELVYCSLGALAFIMGGIVLANRPMPIIGYVLLVVLLAFVAAWAWAYREGIRK